MSLKDLLKRVESIGQLQAQVGWFDTAKYQDGTPVALVAQTQEYGSPARRIPPRPFVRTTIEDKSEEWSDVMGLGLKAVLQGERSPLQVFTAVGDQAVGDIRMTIGMINDPPLEPVTVENRKKKGLEPYKPLQATGKMYSTCSYIVVRK